MRTQSHRFLRDSRRAAERLRLGRFPSPARRKASRPENEIVIGDIVGNKGVLKLGDVVRREHQHIIGAPGGGKTNHLKHQIAQDIRDGAGMCIIDPHARHPDDGVIKWTLSYLAKTGLIRKRTVHLIDPNESTYTTGLNPLARFDIDMEPAVIADACIDAFSVVCRDEETKAARTTNKILHAIFVALIEMEATLTEAPLLLEKADRFGVRARVIAELKDDHARFVLRELHESSMERSGREFREQTLGPINRLSRFLKSPTLRAILGQHERALDIPRALDEGHIILCPLTRGNKASDETAHLLGALLLRFLFFHCNQRLYPERNFYLNVDECHRYLTGDIPSILDEGRKWGLVASLAGQRLQQGREAGENVYDAIKNSTAIKTVFRVRSTAEASELAEDVVCLDLEKPVSVLIKPTVVGTKIIELQGQAHARHKDKSRTRTVSDTEMAGSSEAQISMSASGTGHGAQLVMTMPEDTSAPVIVSEGETSFDNAMESSGSTSGSFEARARSISEAEGTREGDSKSTSSSEAIAPVYAELPSAVYSLEAVRHMAAQRLRALPKGRAIIAIGTDTFEVQIPHVKMPCWSDDRLSHVETYIYRRSTASQPSAKAEFALQARQCLIKGIDPTIGGEDDQTCYFDMGDPEAAPQMEPL